jgi:hypothetical protein
MIPIIIKEKEPIETWFKYNIDRIIGKEYDIISKALKDTFGLECKFEDLILAPYSKLNLIKNEISKNKSKFLNIQPKGFKKENISLPWKEIYDSYDKFVRSQEEGVKLNLKLINKLGVMVCPYCNRDYINNRESKGSAQLDHFFPRSKYPIFAVSLYNLIPACYSCNHTKGDVEISISPYDDSLNFESLLKFTYTPKTMNYLDDSSKINLEMKILEDDNNEDLRNNIHYLQIDKSYEIHNDYIEEIIKKSIMYNDSKINELLADFANLFLTKEEVLRIVFGNYISSKDLGKRPLSKLTKDILQEMGLNLE